jgi:hypothetical protein
MNEKSQVTQERLFWREKERKSTGNHGRGGRTAEKHRKKSRQQRKAANSSKPHSRLPWTLKRKQSYSHKAGELLGGSESTETAPRSYIPACG